MPTFPNPPTRELYPGDLGNVWEAARAAGVKPGTIRVWETRGKIERVDIDGGEPLYHLPTMKAAAQVKSGRPKAA